MLGLNRQLLPKHISLSEAMLVSSDLLSISQMDTLPQRIAVLDSLAPYVIASTVGGKSRSYRRMHLLKLSQIFSLDTRLEARISVDYFCVGVPLWLGKL